MCTFPMIRDNNMYMQVCTMCTCLFGRFRGFGGRVKYRALNDANMAWHYKDQSYIREGNYAPT
jgi:hypothetical protein